MEKQRHQRTLSQSFHLGRDVVVCPLRHLEEAEDHGVHLVDLLGVGVDHDHGEEVPRGQTEAVGALGGDEEDHRSQKEGDHGDGEEDRGSPLRHQKAEVARDIHDVVQSLLPQNQVGEEGHGGDEEDHRSHLHRRKVVVVYGEVCGGVQILLPRSQVVEEVHGVVEEGESRDGQVAVGPEVVARGVYQAGHVVCLVVQIGVVGESSFRG